jgi:hypothetical protein
VRVPENYFDARIARTYEAKWPELFDPAEIEPVVSFLAGLAGSGAALELGIGAGRLAIPLSETFRAFTVTPAHLGFEEYDVARQISCSHHYWITDGKVETFSVPFRYVWPSELDLMARLAGMTLRERWGDWQRAPFTGDSRRHISVWQKAQ